MIVFPDGLKHGLDILLELSITVVPQPEDTDWELYGIDWTGPAPYESEVSATIVEVPDNVFSLSQDVVDDLNRRLVEINNDDGNAVEQYYVARDFVRQLFA